ncbi:MAG TPA: thioredoxin [Panacibacter sp.]|nr:thioredoxin [Panacibacter sp.]HNP43496.1 thioredoxin [Panacibacter sp.]
MESFNSIINGDKPVLVDFHADWCGPCKAMAPAVAAIGKDVQGRARVLKINIDRNHAISQQFNVQAVPTFIIFKNGKPVWRHAGMLEKDRLLKNLLSFA